MSLEEDFLKDFAGDSEDGKYTDLVYAKSHHGLISASQVCRLATYQPDRDMVQGLRFDICELQERIASTTSGRVKTATEMLEAKQRVLDRMLNDRLPDGAVKWCEELACKRITGFCESSDVSFDSKETRWGKDNEPLAIAKIMACYPDLFFGFTGNKQQFILLDDFKFVGATPDAVIIDCNTGNDYAVLDIKCPFNRAIHLLKYGKIQNYAQFKRNYPMYYWQGVLQMMCAGVDKFMFASYDHRFEASGNDLFVYMFDLIKEDAEFLHNRITKAEALINEIITSL